MTLSSSNTHISVEAGIPGPRAMALIARDHRVYAPCMGRVYPFVMERGVGCEVWDVDGNRYLDFNAGIAVVSAGHAHPRIVRAIQDQAARFIHMAATDFYNEPMITLGEKLVATMPRTYDWQVFLANSGTEAVEAAIKLARYATGRQGIIAFFGGFHGRSYGALSLTASKPVQRRGYFPLVPGTFHAFYANPYRPPFDVDPSRVAEACLAYIEDTLFRTVAPPRDIAAIVVEPIQGEGGYVVPAPGFLCGLRQLCDRYGIVLILDEVQSGVGRTGTMWAFEQECPANARWRLRCLRSRSTDRMRPGYSGDCQRVGRRRADWRNCGAERVDRRVGTRFAREHLWRKRTGVRCGERSARSGAARTGSQCGARWRVPDAGVARPSAAV
jgi:4-aminobutyrate aminotransferase